LSWTAVIEERRGRISQDFRLRSAAGPYYWFRLKARPVIGTDGEVVRIVGTIADVTEAKIPAAALLDHGVEGGRVALDVEGMEQGEPARLRPLQPPTARWCASSAPSRT
jgi:hypothetical protein